MAGISPIRTVRPVVAPRAAIPARAAAPAQPVKAKTASPVLEGAASIGGGLIGAVAAFALGGRNSFFSFVVAPVLGAIGGSLLGSKLVSNRPMKDLVGGAIGGAGGALVSGGIGYGAAMMLGRGMGDGGFGLLLIPIATAAIGGIAGTSIGKKLMSHVNISVSTK